MSHPMGKGRSIRLVYSSCLSGYDVFPLFVVEVEMNSFYLMKKMRWKKERVKLPNEQSFQTAAFL